LNAALLRRLSAEPGSRDALFAEPVFECAGGWEAADCTLGELAGNLLHPELVEALDKAPTKYRLSRDTPPWRHQLAAWKAVKAGRSCLVSSGTGSGKTECFMVPVLDDLWRTDGPLVGVRAILLYPLNALIESQRGRLGAWTERLAPRAHFALYNGMTPETPRHEDREKLCRAEIGNRRAIRDRPPTILVTNITMLEYLLLRSRDQPILAGSQGQNFAGSFWTKPTATSVHKPQRWPCCYAEYGRPST